MSKGDQPVRGDLRIYHIPQVPMPAFRVGVADVTAAAEMLRVLARYDRFQYDHRVKGDYSSVQGLEVYNPPEDWDDGDEWTEWYSTDGGDLTEHMRQQDDIGSLRWDGET